MISIGRMIACVVVAMAAIAPAVLVRAADVELAPTVHHPMSRSGTMPIVPAAAAVISEPMVAPT